MRAKTRVTLNDIGRMPRIDRPVVYHSALSDLVRTYDDLDWSGALGKTSSIYPGEVRQLATAVDAARVALRKGATDTDTYVRLVEILAAFNSLRSRWSAWTRVRIRALPEARAFEHAVVSAAELVLS